MLDPNMITREEALRIVLEAARRLETERVAIENSLNRVLAEDVLSDIDMPPFDKSAMDGYACRRQDLGGELSVIETIPAGHVPQERIDRGLCARIMTGAMIPEGADCVIMQEFVESVDAQTIRFVGEDTGTNICRRAENIKVGEAVLSAGELIRPQHVAILASVGWTEPMVSLRPQVGIVATGDELVEPGEKPRTSQIRNSNSYQLSAQVVTAGAVPRYYGIAKDNRKAIDAALRTAISENDVVLISGGVSVGDYDLVPPILKRNGFELLFEKLSIKPGKPTVFGVSDRAFCFGLPGNPVSTFVIFQLLVKPFLLKMMGHDFVPLNIVAPLGETIAKRRTEREAWFPIVLTEQGEVRPIEYHGSAHARALVDADGLIFIPLGVRQLDKGAKVSVRQV